MVKNNTEKCDKRKPKNVLVARFSALGDVAMTIPVMYSVCRCNPDIRFIFITKPATQSLFINAPENLVVIGLDLKEKYHGIGGLIKLFNDLRREYQFDAFADLHNVLRSHIIGTLCRIHRIPFKRINKGKANKRALTRKHNKVMLPLISSRARYREVFLGMGLPLEERFISLYGTGKGDPEKFAEITAPKQDEERWIGIAPFAMHKGKIYPIELMERVLAEISGWSNTKIFLFGGGEGERKVFASWVEKYPSTISLAEKRHGFPVELALMSHLDVMVSMDSGNMHLASIVSVPVVSVWGATHPYCGFKGWKQQETNMVQLSMDCRPCSVFGNKPCHRGDYHCLAGIPPQMIIDKVSNIINKK